MSGGAQGRIPIFVYGTLRPGQPGFDELALAERVDLLGPAMVAGQLHDLGDYPGAVLNGHGRIAGELLMPRDGDVLPMLDSFEAFDPADPASSEYLRVRAHAIGGGEPSIWIYVYNFPLEDIPVIPSGDWNHRQDRGHASSQG